MHPYKILLKKSNTQEISRFIKATMIRCIFNILLRGCIIINIRRIRLGGTFMIIWRGFGSGHAAKVTELSRRGIRAGFILLFQAKG